VWVQLVVRIVDLNYGVVVTVVRDGYCCCYRFRAVVAAEMFNDVVFSVVYFSHAVLVRCCIRVVASARECVVGLVAEFVAVFGGEMVDEYCIW